MQTKPESITLTTSDDPPVAISVSRTALVAHSKVFADMFALDLARDDHEGPITLAETEEELETFLMLMEGRESEADFGSLCWEDWETLAKLADKYDCLFVRKYVEAKAWQVEAEKGWPGFSFTLATLCGNHALINHTAKRAVLLKDFNHSRFRASREWKVKLATWRAMQEAAYFRNVRTTFGTDGPGLDHECSNGADCGTRAEQEWSRLGIIALDAVDRRFSKDFLHDLYSEVCEIAGLCLQLRVIMLHRLGELREGIKSSNDFPLSDDPGELALPARFTDMRRH